MPTGWIADRLSSARADAERIARELSERGLLTPAELDAIVAAVDAAIERGATLLTDALRQPKQVLDELRSALPRLQAAADSTDVATQGDTAPRLAAVEARLAALEKALLAGSTPPGDDRGGR